ncbi:hypothetical protein BDP27DRAFT_1336210 [Rhodocollybia butyracea]|uniref:Uncharacterized protein n=1 Tax=Rhodocollybia butyracea TaxID=206335 RepID=A0A9P5PCP9_9AGAR|nr:hypothetical protein BDP27DRAFT_1336210 [Rhodocollybia butyracea]
MDSEGIELIKISQVINPEDVHRLREIIPEPHIPHQPFDWSPSAPYDGKLLRHVNVPLPPKVIITDLDQAAIKAQRRAGLILSHYVNDVLNFKADKSMEYLQGRHTEMISARTRGEELILTFANVSPNPFSVRIYTSDGKRVLSAFQLAAPSEMVKKNRQLTEANLMPSVSEQPGTPSSSTLKGYKSHSMPDNFRLNYAQATQRLLSLVPPERYDSKKRHAGQDKNLQTSNYTVHRGWNGQEERQGERCGTLHVIQGWCQTGHGGQYMSLSKSFTSNPQAYQAHDDWFQSSMQANVWLDALFEHEYPEWHAHLSKAHKAARWFQRDPGPHNGRVIIYHKHSSDHMDDGDLAPTAVCVVSGNYMGGFLDLLDIKTRLHYRPGAVVIGYFGRLWHVVTPHEDRPCTPSEDVVKHGLTPGRVATVSYFPATSFAQLHDKPEGWAKKTNWGRSKTE